MSDQPQAKRPHLILRDTSHAVRFTAKSSPVKGKDVPVQPRQQHAASLQSQIEELKATAAQAVRVQKDLQLESGLGLQIQFTSQPDVVLAFESLANATKKIELLSVREEGNRTLANVFVPDGQFAHFEQYVADYLAQKRGTKNQALDHRKLLDAIESIRLAQIKSLWTDAPELLPVDSSRVFWWEVWLPVRGPGQRQSVVEDFKKLARLSDCVVSDKQVNFPERTVLLMYGSQQQLSRSAMTFNCVAELRYAKETAEFFDGMEVEEQRQWADDLMRRIQFEPADDAPRICLLDSGVTRAHPLLEPLMETADLHTVEPAWGVDDQADHGTGLAGLAAYGDLTDVLSSSDAISVPYRLESVKLVPEDGANEGDARHHAYLFMEGVARPEISAPGRARVFTSAVTASDYRDRGRPSSWSAAIDGLAADADGAGDNPRLFVLSAGNNRDANAWATYPDCLATNLVHDPAQAWNAITVGAYTDKIDTRGDSSLNPIAEAGGISPFTTTTRTWDRMWPLKPDLVLEGGNAAKDDFGASWMSSLSLLTTHNEPQARLFTTSNATSAASALCAGMAARIMATYPHLRAETVRALMVHSARWSDAMRAMFLPAAPNKDHFVNLIRHCGWGIPDLNRALWSAGDSLTLVVEDLVYPYTMGKGKRAVTRDMNVHDLPWPKDELEALQDTPVEMRVTLSYFVEPNPSARGVASKYHYPSHRLRFDVQRPLDASPDHFIARLNAAAQREDEGDGVPVNPSDPNWLLGGQRRHRGSLHQDVWKGTAAELASRGLIAVYPAAGWWRTRAALERYGLPARYSLVVSIETQQTDVDLYTAVAQKIPVANAVVVDS